MRDLDLVRRQYDEDRFVPLPGLVSAELLDMLVAYANILGATGRFEPDRAVSQALSRYGAPAFDALLVYLMDEVTAIVGAPLSPTYSYARVYYEGDALRRHRDRPACEHSVTLHLDSSGGVWPVEFLAISGETARLELDPGDAVLYRGIELPHWRGPCPVEWYLQLFLHWVEADGAHADEALDRRLSLGMPSVRGLPEGTSR